MQGRSRELSRRFLLAGLALAILFSGGLPSGAQPVNSGEGFLVVVLLKTQIQIDRAKADIEAVDLQLKANELIIQDAERKLAIALETNNAQAGLGPGNDLRSARAARAKLKKTRSGLEEVRARAETTDAIVRNKLVPGQRLEADSLIIGMVSPDSGNAVVLKKDGKRIALKRGKPGFLESGDEVLAGSAGHDEVQVLDGRGMILLGARSRLKVEEDNPQEQVLRIAQGKLYAALDWPEDLERTFRGMSETSDEALNVILKKYQSLDRSEIMRLFGRNLKILIPAGVCTLRGKRIGIEIKNEGATEISMFEGTGEVSDPRDEKHLLVGENSVTVVTKDGISEPQRIGRIDKWWEKKD